MGLIAAGTTLASSATNAFSQGSVNKKTRQWNEKMYNLQNQRDIDYWNMQNEYNSPEKQMERFTKAGLNPNLIYGNGTSTTAGSIDTSSAPAWNPRAPEIDLAPAARDGLAAYFDVQTKQANVDNLKAQNTVLIQDAALKAATTAQTATSTAKTQFDLNLASELKQTSLEAAKEALRTQQIGNTFQLSENERRNALNKASLQQAAESILLSRQQQATSVAQRQQIDAAIKDLNSSNELKQLDINLKRQGINPQDPMWIRILGQAMQGLFKKENFLGERFLKPSQK